MKVLVTGGAGFVGTNLVKRLLNDGHDVVSIDNYSTGKKENEQEGCTYLDIDLAVSTPKHGSWGQGKFQLEKPDVIYHMAALARIQPSLKEPHPHLKNNLDSTLNILEYAREKGGIPVVYAGSSSKHHGLYGSPYAWSKWQGEELCKLYNKVFGVPMGICRFYNVYGEYQLEDGDYATVLGIFEKQYREGRPLTITGDGEQRRDFTHIEDIVDGLVKCGNSLLIPNAYNAKVSGEEFELGRGINFSINELAEMFGENYPTKYIPARNGEYPSTLCTDENASKLLGWTPSKNVEDYIESIIK